MAGGNSIVGTITSGGLYTAPADLPVPASLPGQASVEVRATSQADPTKFAAAQVTIASDIALSLAPATASVELGAAQSFLAMLTSSGHPDSSVRWSLSGVSCPANCGSVDASGAYTAPQVLPSPTLVALTAQSVADPSKQASATIAITSNFSLSLSTPASVPVGATTSVTATLQPVPGSNPSTSLTWSLSGAGCSGSACGSLTPATVTPGGGMTFATATYAAPNASPNPNIVIITVTPQADPSRKTQATLAVVPNSSGVTLNLSPVSATLAANRRLTLSVQVAGTTDATVTWNVNGVAGGNTTVGQICAAGSTPCQAVTTSAALQVVYLAPGAIPLPNPVVVRATSQADPSVSASALITVISHIQVTVQPASVTLAPTAVQAFTASVLGTEIQTVVWQVQGAGCGGAGLPCGSIDAGGVYTAPASAPTPNAFLVVAISTEDTSQSGSANVSISTGANIRALLPASVYAGGTAGFTLKVEGSGFVSSTPGPGSSLVIAGTPRTTVCRSANECTAPVQPADVAAPGNISVQIRNPDGSVSNQVLLVVVTPSATEEAVALTAASPSTIGKDIVVVEPTTAGVDQPGNSVDLNVAALGGYSAANNSCTLAGNPVPLVRPASGAIAADVCLFSSSGLDASMTYTVSGPGDIAVIAKQPAGLGIIHLTLQVPSNALPGARTLFIQNSNLDRAAATGALEVK